MERGTDFVDVGAVGADGVVEDFTGDTKLFGPVRNIRGELGVDDFGVVRAGGVLLVWSVRGVFFRSLAVIFGHRLSSFAVLEGG